VPLVSVALVATGWRLRAHLRPLVPTFGSALLAILPVGGIWYLRDFLTHGSPFWPIVTTPWGDSVPPVVRFIYASFLDHPGATIAGLGHEYLTHFAGGLLLLVGAVLAPLAAPRWRVALGAIVVIAAALVWARSPVTGLPSGPGMRESVFLSAPISTTRYLLPVLAAAATTLALASAQRMRFAFLALVVLAAAAVVNLMQTLALGFPNAPGAATPIVGAIAGGAVALLTSALRLPARRRFTAVPQAVATIVTAVAGGLLAIPAHGFVARHGRTGGLLTSQLVAHLADVPGSAPVASTPDLIAPLAGDDLRHELDWVFATEGCVRIRARARREWLVAARRGSEAPVVRCLAGIPPFYEDPAYVVYAPRGHWRL